jgi:hypothetical protein
MRHNDLILRDQRNSTHPYLATIAIDPAIYAKFTRTFEDQAEVSILDVDMSKPDAWTVTAACASRSICDLLESNW